ncbi:MAG: TetR/AcrR family transcriptional regulator [Thermodesulfobacteriota bacterium]
MGTSRRSTVVRKRQIIDAARKLMIKYGSEHITIRRLAKEVRITEAAIYRHFKSKRDILSFLTEHITESMLVEIGRTADGPIPSLEVIHATLRNHLSIIEQRKGMSFQILAEIISFGDKRLNRQIAEFIEKYVYRLEIMLYEGVSAGLVRSDVNLSSAALLLFGMIQGLVNVWAINNYGFDLVEKFASLWEVFKKSVEKPLPPQAGKSV